MSPEGERQMFNDSHVQQAANNIDLLNNPTLGLPSVVSDDYVYRLVDLVNSDFRMPESDKDFTLSTE